jgi:cellulose synthase/poly-beta-1,6-N-acetylglucosamine synthase-like glycosyltransferase
VLETCSVAGFLLLSCLIAYTVAGYPLLLGWLARRRARPVRKQPQPRTVSVVMAVYNGAPFLAEKLNSILNLAYPRELLEIIVVSDGSTDSTDEIAFQFAPQGVRLLRVPHGGKPAALNAGIAQASGEIVLLTDVRQPLEPASVARIVACFADPAVGVVSGDLIVRQGDLEETNVGLYWRYERWIRKQLGKLDSTLGATGPFYAIRRELTVPIPPDSLLDDVYLPLAAFFRGYRLIVEEQARAFDHPTGVKTEFGRKVRTLAGNYQLLWQYPALLSFRNRMLFHYISCKLARLMLPWMLLLLLIASCGLPWPWRPLALAAQGLFYLLAALDFATPPKLALKRLTSPARTVVSMLAAAACATAVFFVPPQQLWKPTRVRLPEKGKANRLS